MKRCVYLGVLLGFLCAGLMLAQDSKIRALPFPEVHLGPNGEGAEGYVWLGWTDDQQLFFVNGFVQGFRIGWKASCGKSTELARTNVYSECVDARSQAEKPFNVYRNEATEFYTKYPEDLALPIDRLFSKLVESGMTAPKVHEWLNELVEKWGKAKPKESPPPSQ